MRGGGKEGKKGKNATAMPHARHFWGERKKGEGRWVLPAVPFAFPQLWGREGKGKRGGKREISRERLTISQIDGKKKGKTKTLLRLFQIFPLGGKEKKRIVENDAHAE